MDCWAIVIGVNEYRDTEHALKGAVNDAVEVANWLVGPGGVPPRNLSLHLSGTAGTRPPVIPLAADRSTIVDGLERLLARSGAEGDRFYFYFAGHGLSSSVSGGGLQSAVLPSNFRSVEADQSFTLASLFALLAGTNFKEQFFFIDACRNLPFSTDKVLGRYPNERPARTPPWPQFVMFATQPGVKAIEVRTPNDEHGAFTRALLEGLRGDGAAKVWSEKTGEYSVRWNGVFQHVERRVQALRLAAAENGALIQMPQQYGERGTQNPLFASLPEGAVPPLNLAVTVEPAVARPVASLRVTNLAGEVASVAAPLPAPAPIRLPPRMYGVTAQAAGFRMRQRLEEVELYEDSQLNITLVPDVGGAGVPPQQTVTRGGGAPDVVFHVVDREAGGAEATGAVRLMAQDDLAWVELADPAGEPVQAARGMISMSGLQAGFYRASLVAPEGSRYVQTVPVVAGEVTYVDLVPAAIPMSPALAWVVRGSGMPVARSGAIQPSEAVGMAHFLKLSTLLALAVGAAHDDTAGVGYKLRWLALPRLQLPQRHSTRGGPAAAAEANGVYLVLGDEASGAEAIGESPWAGAKLVCVKAGAAPDDTDGHVDVVPHQGAPAIASAAMPLLAAGPYGLRVEVPGQVSVTLPIVALPGWLALVVLTRESDGRIEIHHYQLPLPGDAAARRQGPDATAFATLRRVELMQRMVQAGRVTPARPDVDLLLQDKWRDPIAGCLGCYLLLRLGDVKSLSTPARNIARYFPDLPDGHLLLALMAERREELASARQALEVAHRAGLPVFRDGLALMAAIARRLGAEALSAHAEAWLARVPEGSLFSAEITPFAPAAIES